MTDLTDLTDFEPGSFRDRTNRVFYRDGAVLRGLNPHAAQEWEALTSKPFFQQFMTAGKLVRTEQIELASSPLAKDEQWSVVLQHQPIPFISYPYEWSFSMLQDAALLTLELQDAALRTDMTLKDATPFNVQWSGSRPVFIDIPSFERLRPGEPWVGYRQFCQLFLYPLFLQAYKDVPFQPWLRGNLEGIEPSPVRATHVAQRYASSGHSFPCHPPGQSPIVLCPHGAQPQERFTPGRLS